MIFRTIFFFLFILWAVSVQPAVYTYFPSPFFDYFLTTRISENPKKNYILYHPISLLSSVFSSFLRVSQSWKQKFPGDRRKYRSDYGCLTIRSNRIIIIRSKLWYFLFFNIFFFVHLNNDINQINIINLTISLNCVGIELLYHFIGQSYISI